MTVPSTGSKKPDSPAPSAKPSRTLGQPLQRRSHSFLDEGSSQGERKVLTYLCDERTVLLDTSLCLTSFLPILTIPFSARDFRIQLLPDGAASSSGHTTAKINATPMPMDTSANL